MPRGANHNGTLSKPAVQVQKKAAMNLKHFTVFFAHSSHTGPHCTRCLPTVLIKRSALPDDRQCNAGASPHVGTLPRLSGLRAQNRLPKHEV